MSELVDAPVVTCFLRHRGEVLLLRRSKKVGSYRGQWGGVAGYVEAGEDADSAAWREIEEETGLHEKARLVRRGEPFNVEDEKLGKRWIVHPYLFDVDDREARLDWESVEAAWVAPTEILRREAVPRLWTSYERVAPSVASIVSDRVHGSAYLSLRALEVLRDRAGALGARGTEPARVWRELADLADELICARPSMAALENRVERVLRDATRAESRVPAVESEAHRGIARVVEDDENAARRAAELVAGQRVLTLSRSGTVTAALLSAEPRPTVIVAESRPGLEGVSVAEQLARSGVAVTLVTDAALADAAQRWNVERVLVGADTVLRTGAVINKTGTRLAALVAKERGIPLNAVAASDKISTREAIELEESDPSEVYGGNEAITVHNRLFEVTPAELVTSIVTERGVLDRAAIRRVALEMKALRDWRGAGGSED